MINITLVSLKKLTLKMGITGLEKILKIFLKIILMLRTNSLTMSKRVQKKSLRKNFPTFQQNKEETLTRSGEKM